MNQNWNILKSEIDSQLLGAIASLQFKYMTPVQAACIPQFINKKDVAVEAVTGSGKTLAFVVPMMQILISREATLKKHEIGAIILTPTRELAFQIQEVVTHFINFFPHFTTGLFIGGGNPYEDVKKLSYKGAHIIISTPGRLQDLLQRKEEGVNLAASVKSLEVLILDEADRLLDMGFEASINSILSYLPKQRRTGLFSATQTDEVAKLIRAGLRNPMQITVKEKTQTVDKRTPSTLKNYYMIVEADKKLSQLVSFLRAHKKEKVMVFFSTCACVDYFSKCLSHILKKHEITAIHSKMKHKRNRVFDGFRKKDSGVLMCTDVMARGVDIPDVHWVVQFDPPSSASSFVHRCGRTARIGNHGNALVMLLPKEDSYIKFIEINQKVPLEQTEQLEASTDLSTRIQTLALNDRSIYEKGIRAYVSFIQSYAKHECNMVLRLKDLDFGKLAQGFGLLHLPKMPELRGKTVSNFYPVETDITAIPYKNKQQELKRQERLASGQESGKPKVKRLKTPAWSKQKEKREKKKQKKENKKLKGEKRKKEIVDEENEDENDDFGEDIRLMKKLKKGKITEEDFNKEFAADVSD